MRTATLEFSENRPHGSDFLEWPARASLLIIQAVASVALPLFLLALAAMLFRPSELEFYSIDRFVFALLVVAAGLRAMIMRHRIDLPRAVLVPMMGLSGVGLFQVLAHAFDATTWSVLAARFFCAVRNVRDSAAHLSG